MCEYQKEKEFGLACHHVLSKSSDFNQKCGVVALENRNRRQDFQEVLEIAIAFLEIT